MWEPLNTDTSSDNKNMENMMYDGTLYDSETDVVKNYYLSSIDDESLNTNPMQTECSSITVKSK